MTITLDNPTRRRLEARAKREGKKAEDVASLIVAESLQSESVEDRESDLLRLLSEGLPEGFWQRKANLDEKAARFALTELEYEERTALITRFEQWSVQRLEWVLALAQLRHENPHALMQRLGLIIK